MKMSVKFAGPASDELADAGAIDLSDQGYEHVFVGKGTTKAAAMDSALNKCVSVFDASTFDQAYSLMFHKPLTSEHHVKEADGVLCNVFCIMRVTV